MYINTESFPSTKKQLDHLNVLAVLKKCGLTGKEASLEGGKRKVTSLKIANDVAFWARVDAQLFTKNYEEGMKKAFDLAVARLSVIYFKEVRK